jgi:hypothetical protein
MSLFAKAIIALCLLGSGAAFAQDSNISLANNTSLKALHKALVIAALQETTQEESEGMNKCLTDVMTAPVILDYTYQESIKILSAKHLNEVLIFAKELGEQNIDYNTKSIDEITEILASTLSSDGENGLTAFADGIGAIDLNKELFDKQISQTPSCQKITE